MKFVGSHDVMDWGNDELAEDIDGLFVLTQRDYDISWVVGIYHSKEAAIAAGTFPTEPRGCWYEIWSKNLPHVEVLADPMRRA